MDRPRFKSYRSAEAFDALMHLRAESATSGWYPVSLIDRTGNFEWIRDLPVSDEVDTILARSRSIVLPAWFGEQVDAEPDRFVAADGDWPDYLEEYDLVSTIEEDLRREPNSEVMIGLFHVSAAWEVFAHLGWGGWNDCPGPQEHCAVHRYWEKRHGAQIAVISPDRIDCIVQRPPARESASMELARQQYAYSPDIVDQGCTYVSRLAATVMKSDHWYFWWD